MLRAGRSRASGVFRHYYRLGRFHRLPPQWGWGTFAFTGTGLSIEGQGLAAGSIPNRLGTDPLIIDATIASDSGNQVDSSEWLYGSAIVGGVNYGSVAFIGAMDTSLDGQLTQQQWNDPNGGSRQSPGTLTLNLQGCAIPTHDVSWCSTGILFNLQFTLQGTNTLTWSQDGTYPSVTFNASTGTTPEPGSLALFGLGLAAVLFHLKLRKRLFGL